MSIRIFLCSKNKLISKLASWMNSKPSYFHKGGKGLQIQRLGQPLRHDEGYETKLVSMLQKAADNGSTKALNMLKNWSNEKGNWLVVVPEDYAAARNRILERERAIRNAATGPQALTMA
jgi:hypothetical protein